MWYEILPVSGIIFGLIALPPVAGNIFNRIFNNGKWVMRYWDANQQDWHLYLRDRRITGSEYVPKGLEGLDEGVKTA